MKTLKHYLFFILSLFSVVVFFTSCDKITDLLGGEEGNDDESEIIGEIETSDGKEPYFKFTSEAVVLPACGKNHEEWENSYTIKYETNIINGISFCLDSFKKFEENGDNIETLEDIPYFILREPRFDMQSQSETVFDYYTNPKTEDIKDKILVYMYNKPDSLIASIDITQTAGEWVKVVDAEKDIKSVTLHLQNSENAVAYGVYITKEYTPLSVLQREVAQSDNGYSVFRERQESTDNGKTLKFENLEENQEYFVNIAAIDKYDNFTGITQYIVSTDTRGEEHELRMKFLVTEPNNRTVYLPFAGNVKGYLNWGDGTEEYINKYCNPCDLKHIYDKVGDVVVSFRGVLTKLLLYNSDEKVNSTLLSIEQWGDTDLEEIKLSYFNQLESIPEDKIGAFKNIKSFEEVFKNCTSLTVIPEGLFSKAINATDFTSAFQGCTNLTVIPENLFSSCTNAIIFNSVFSLCKNLKEIPERIFSNNTLLSDVSYAFYGCDKILDIPQNLFVNNRSLRDISCVFKKCSSLKTIPVGLFKNNKEIVSITDISDYGRLGYDNLYGLFEDCTSLERVSEDLFSTMTKVEIMGAVFKGCTNLKELPAGLFKENKKVYFMNSAFEKCTSLTSIPISLFDSMRGLTNIRNLFLDCTSLSCESPFTKIDYNGQDVNVHFYERNNYYPMHFQKIKDGYNAFKNTKVSDIDKFNGRWWE